MSLKHEQPLGDLGVSAPNKEELRKKKMESLEDIYIPIITEHDVACRSIPKEDRVQEFVADPSGMVFKMCEVFAKKVGNDRRIGDLLRSCQDDAQLWSELLHDLREAVYRAAPIYTGHDEGATDRAETDAIFLAGLLRQIMLSSTDQVG